MACQYSPNISLVLHEYLAKYSTSEEAAKHASEALVSMQHFEEAVEGNCSVLHIVSKTRFNSAQSHIYSNNIMLFGF
jgi:hypothetical protein